MKKKTNKHSKFKNTGVLFELLVRQITSDTLSGVKNSPAIKILEKYFNSKTNIRKEIQLYHTLQNQKFNSETKANRFIDAVIKENKKINKSILRNEKYNLIKEIKSNYNLESFFKTKISNYKLNASISKTLDREYTNPSDKVRSRYTVIEHIIGNNPIKVNDAKEKVIKEYKKQDTDLRVLSYKILLEKFNSKYGKLNVNQKTLLREYINNISNSKKLKEYSDSEAIKIADAINKKVNKVDDKVIKIKLNEVKDQIVKMQSERKLKDVHLVSLLRSYDLLRELKNVTK
tara:strand:- start:884 stop:1747 length:864 start_codon:yes stop_codon:yes gene_type:complete